MSDSPIFLTKNSHGTSVIMSIKQYSSLTDTFKRKQLYYTHYYPLYCPLYYPLYLT